MTAKKSLLYKMDFINSSGIKGLPFYVYYLLQLLHGLSYIS